MFARVDRKTAETTRVRCGCEGHRVRTSCRPRLVVSEWGEKGARQTTRLRLRMYRSCCFASFAGQKAFWDDVVEEMGKLPGGLDRRELTIRIAEKVSRDLGPVERVTDLAHDDSRRLLARWVDDDGVEWARYLSGPDMSRLSYFPPEIGKNLRSALRVEHIAKGVAEDGSLDEETWEFHAHQLGGLGRSEDLSEAQSAELSRLSEASFQTSRRVARRVAERARLAALEARQPRPKHVPAVDLASARARVRRFVAQAKGRNDRRLVEGAQEFFRAWPVGRKRSLSRGLLEFVARLRPERLLVVSSYLKGRTQVEAGRRAFASASVETAQRAASRHLRGFRLDLRRALALPEAA
ncbi:MAG: hypothetical protein JKY65_19710 [Planctomycetes bacterium]|nr:hypothetical protein [Planctomycetota bacterium]